MTRDQITYALNTASVSFGVWTTLEGDFKYIALNSDKNIYYYPQSVQLYFSPTSDYFLVRYTSRELPVLYTSGTVPAGYVLIVHDGNQYKVRLDDGGAIDASVDAAGVFHEIYSFDSIAGMFFK